jgi:hypothetical protein
MKFLPPEDITRLERLVLMHGVSAVLRGLATAADNYAQHAATCKIPRHCVLCGPGSGRWARASRYLNTAARAPSVVDL